MVFTAALVCGFLAWRLKQPILLGYVLAGLLLSPLTPGPRVHDTQNFEVMAEIGVVLLMFSVGIEFSVPELLKVKWAALGGAPLGILLCVGLGMAVGAALGWPLIQGVAVGCIISVASTMVLLRLLMDRGEMAAEHGRLMVTLSLVEDLAVVILTVVLPSFSPNGGATLGEAGWKVAKAILLLVPIAVAAWKLFPPLLVRVERTCNDEISLLLALTICLGIAGLTEAVGLSLALGAFLAGLFLGNSPFTHKLAHQTQSLRDVFVAFFFVSVGMLMDPHMEGKLAADSAAGGAGALRKICRVDGGSLVVPLSLPDSVSRGPGFDADRRVFVHPCPGFHESRVDFAELIPRDAGGFADYDSGQRYDFSLPETASRKPTSRL